MPIPDRNRLRLGELLVEHGLINTHQLKDALKRQAREGGQIGSILVGMGRITNDDLLSFLSRQLGIPSANLFKMDVSPDILKLMPLEKIRAMKVIPIGISETTVTLAMVNPHDMISIRDIEFSLGKKVEPVVVPASQMDAAIQSLISSPESGVTGEKLEKEACKAEIKKAASLLSLLKYLATSPPSDMLLTAGIPPCVKLSRDIKRTSMDSLVPSDCERYARELMTEKDWEAFAEKGDHDLAVTYPDIGRFRASFYRQRNSISITVRHIADILPSLEELGLPAWLKEYVLIPEGLILVAGPAGHGKTTTIAAMVDIINSEKKCNIITLEDPIEYLHKHKKSNVNQREIGVDTQSFHEGLKHIFRQDPDVIAIGEMSDADSFAVALQAACTGHLVITAVHANNAAQAIDTIANTFPPHRQDLVRSRIADTLLFVLSQRLVPLKKGEGRVLAYEKLVNSHSVNGIIREGKTHQIKSQMMTGTDEYSSLESSLAKLHLSGLIKFDDGLLFSENRQFYKDFTKVS